MLAIAASICSGGNCIWFGMAYSKVSFLEYFKVIPLEDSYLGVSFSYVYAYQIILPVFAPFFGKISCFALNPFKYSLVSGTCIN